MWKIWKEELFKITSRKIVWLAVFLLLAFISLRLYSEQNTYTVTIDGQVLRGREAIQKDRELTKRYAGTLSLQKLKQIYETYGFFHYDDTGSIRVGNYCNQYLTMKFTNYMQTDGDNLEEIHFLEKGDWDRNAAPLLKKKPRFDYVYGWNDFAGMYITALLALFSILIIGLAPLFAEEYQLKTADILRTTKRGKQSGIWMKLLAALFFAVILTCAVSIFIFAVYLNVYGAQGLDASAFLLNSTTFYGYCPDTVLGFFLFLAALGIAGAILLSGLTTAVSALCKSPFLALTIAFAVYLLPILWIKVLGPMEILGESLTRKVSHFMASMPLYLPMSTAFSFSAKQVTIHLCIALAAACAGIFLGYHRYRNS